MVATLERCKVTSAFVVMFSLILCAVLLAGCGGASKGGVSKRSGVAKTSYGQPTGTTLTAADVAVAHAFVGGKLGKATGSPIDIGLVGFQGPGIPAVPGDNTTSAAVDMINNRLDGVDGHRVVLMSCDIGVSSQAATQCGQKFRNDSAVKAILNPGAPNYGLQFLGTVGGKKPEFCTVPGTAEELATNVFCPYGGVEAANATLTYLRDKAKIKTVAEILPDSPTFQALTSVFTKEMAAVGLHATVGLIPLNSPDVLSAVVASGAQHANAIFLTLPGASECAPVAQALKTLNIAKSVPIIALTNCVDPSVAKSLGGLPTWTYLDLGPSPYITPVNPQIKVYLDANYTYGKVPIGAYGQGLFGTTLLLDKMFNEVGAAHITTPALVAKTKAFTGPMFLGPPKIRFGAGAFPNFGSLAARFYTYEGNAKWVDATDGKYIQAPGS